MVSGRRAPMRAAIPPITGEASESTTGKGGAPRPRPFPKNRALRSGRNSPLIKSAVMLNTTSFWAAKLLVGAACCAAREPAALCQRAVKRDAAPGVDGLTWRAYEADLDRRIADLYERVRRGAYRAQPARRRYIPKPDGRQRPLAVAALEDKIVQRATVAVLEAIYETEFLGFSYGFRPGRSQHDALDALVVGITSTKVNYILDADIRSFFDEVSQRTLVCFLQHRIGDQRILRLVQKWLQAGVLEDKR
jgi:hypothetical protein